MRLTLRTLALGFVLAALVPSGILGGQSAEGSKPLQGEIGSWKLALAKSHYDPGPPPKSQTMVRERAGQGVRVTRKIVDAQGKPLETVATGTYDGKEYPVKGNPAYDSTATKRVDAFHLEGTRKSRGTVVQTYSYEISKDGRVLTTTTKGSDARGRKINNVEVFDRQ